MRGIFRDEAQLFSYVSPESRVPPGHPLRKIRSLVRDVLKELSRSFAKLYAKDGRPSVPPEQLLSTLLIQALYGIRSERQLMEQLNYNLLYRWFVGLSPDDPVWDPTTFTKNRERLQAGEVFEKFMTRLLNHAQVKPLLSDQHFSVDGTLIEAWASQRSFRPKSGSDGDGSDFHGQTRKYPPEHHRPRLPVVSQGSGPRGEAGLHGTCHHGEPSWAGGGRPAQQGHWHGRAACVRGDARDQTQAGRPPHHGRCGQGL